MTTSSPGAPVASRPFVASVSLVSLILSLLPLRSGRLRGGGRLRLCAIRRRPLHQARDGIGQLGALVPPMLDAIERDTQRLFTFARDRIVKTDPLDESSVAAIARVGHNNVEERPFLRPTAGESDDYHGLGSLSFLDVPGKLEKDIDYTMETSVVATRPAASFSAGPGIPHASPAASSERLPWQPSSSSSALARTAQAAD